jgi:hypothetical protein
MNAPRIERTRDTGAAGLARCTTSVDGGGHVERVAVVLRVVADLDAGAEPDGAAVRGQLAGDHLEQRGLAGAVLADDADLLAAPRRQRHRAQHHVIAVGLAHAVELEHLADGALGGREAEAHDVALLEGLDVLHLLEHLDARLHRARLVGLGAEAVDEGQQVLALALEVLGLAGEDGLLLEPGLDVLLVVAGVAAHALGLERHHPRDLLVQELAVVADQDERAVVALEEVAEPRHRRQVEVVGRLVEQQHVGALEQQRREHRAHLPAARELAQVAIVIGDREAQAGQDRLRLVRREEPVEVVLLLVQLGDALGQLDQVVVARRVVADLAQLGLGGGQVAIELGPPRHAVEHERQERGAAAERQVLRQPADPHALGAGDLAVVDLLDAGDDLEQRGLARAVGPDQADAIVVADAQAGRVEDHPIGEEQRDVFEDDQAHGGAAYTARRRRPLPSYGTAAISAAIARSRSATAGWNASGRPARRAMKYAARSLMR